MYGGQRSPQVIVDPGHGGTTAYGGSSPYGSGGQGGQHEKHVNLELARRVTDRLGSAALMTRTGDVNVPLRERAELARRTGARVLVSIHANSGPSGTHGSEVWIHDRTDPRSTELAHRVHDQLDRVGPTRGVYRGPLTILDPAATGGVAACLVEADYLSSPQGARRLQDPRALDTIADAIANGVRAYLHDSAYGAPWSQAAAIIEPDIDYSATSLAEANRIWNDWLERYGRWSKGVPDTCLSYFPHSAICQMRMTMLGSDGRTRHFWGTGFYIGREKLLTCGHNFRDRDSSGRMDTATEILVEPGYSPRASFHPTKSFTISNYLDHVHPNWSSATGDPMQRGYDIAVLRVPGLSAPGGNVFSLANRSLSPNEGIVVSGYGKVDGQRFADQPQRMDGAFITQADHATMSYPIQTEGGHSGSPVFHGSMVIGVHRSTSGDHANAAVTLTPEKIGWIDSM